MRTITTNKIWALAWPLILSNISIPLLGLVDTAVLGHLPDPQFLASVAIGSAIIAFVYWAFGFLRMGTTGVTAQAYGSQNTRLVGVIFFRACTLALIICSIVVLLHPWLFQFGLWAMNTDTTINALADQYLNIRLISAPAALLNYVAVGWLIGVQRPKTALLVVVICNTLNILLDLILVVGLDMTSAGVAWATVIAEYTACIIAVIIITKHIDVKIDFPFLRQIFNVHSLTKLASGNGYLFVRTVALLMTMAFFTKKGAEFGVITLAANALLMQLAMMVSYALDGFANAAEALVGEAVGNNDTEKLYSAMKGTAYASIIVGVLFSIFIGLFQGPLIALLTSQAEVMDAASIYYPYIIIFPIVAVWSFWLDGVFIGANRNAEMMWSMLFASGIVFSGLLFTFQTLLNTGLWLAYLGFIAARGVSLGYISYRYTKRNAWFKSS